MKTFEKINDACDHEKSVYVFPLKKIGFQPQGCKPGFENISLGLVRELVCNTGPGCQIKRRSTQKNRKLRIQTQGLDHRIQGFTRQTQYLIDNDFKSQPGGFVYDLKTFRQISDFHYTGEGWALTRDGTHLIMSDGTSELRVLDPDTLHETARIHVACEGRPVRSINELEWVKGEIYANIWLTNLIARINPATGEVAGLIDLTDLAARAGAGRTADVLNGIAYDARADRLFVTGKLWPALYQITLSRRPDARDLCKTLP